MYKGRWNVLIWFGLLVIFAGRTIKVGLIEWMVDKVSGVVGGFN